MGYDLVYDNSPTNAGGVALYVRKSFNFSVINEFRLDVSDCESIFIELDLSQKSCLGSTQTLLVGCIYRHPRPHSKCFIDKLSKLIEGYSMKNNPILIMGDINL